MEGAFTIHITIDNLSKVIRGKRVLDAVSLALPNGITALVGANGSGKTSLLKCISGLWKPSSGRILYGQNGSIPRRSMGYLIDPPSFYEHLTAVDMLRYYVVLTGGKWDREFHTALLDAWRIPRGRIKGFSRGQRQRLGIVCSVWHGPNLWLLDEPFTGLDHEGSTLLWNALHKHTQTEENSGILVLHDGHDFPKAIGHVVEIVDGRTDFSGSAGSFFVHALSRVSWRLPIHWQPVLSLHEIPFSVEDTSLALAEPVNEEHVIKVLWEAGFNPLSLLEKGETHSVR